MTDEMAIVQRLFTRAAMRLGSATHLAEELGIPYAAVRLYMYGEAMPSEEVLLKVTGLILNDLPEVLGESAAKLWTSRLFPDRSA